jgi:hypothetical protein
MTSTGFGARHSSAGFPNGIPQRPQNFVAAEYVFPQREQVVPLGAVGSGRMPETGSVCNSPDTGWNVVLPQRPQNFTPSAKRE